MGHRSIALSGCGAVLVLATACAPSGTAGPSVPAASTTTPSAAQSGILDSSLGTPVDLPVSDWSPQGGSAFGLSLAGMLVRDGDCIRLRLADGSSVTPVWPSGHVAYERHGVIVVLDGQGREVARTGTDVDYVGGYGDAPYLNAGTADPNGTFLVQEDIVRGY